MNVFIIFMMAVMKYNAAIKKIEINYTWTSRYVNDLV